MQAAVGDFVTIGDDMIAVFSGRTEGVSTKTKVIKRQMYGRAGFIRLRHRILLS
jgi:transposase